MTQTCSNCPCVASSYYVDKRSGRKRRFFLVFHDMETNDANEWRRFTSFFKFCHRSQCGCDKPGAADCIARCGDTIAAVEFTTYAREKLFKDAMCHAAGKRVAVLIHTRAPLPAVQGKPPIKATLCDLKNKVCSAKDGAVVMLIVS